MNATLTGTRLRPKLPGVTDRPADASPHASAGHVAIFPLHPRFTWIETSETFEVCVTVTSRHIRIVARDALAAAGLPVAGGLEFDPPCAFMPGNEVDVPTHSTAQAWTHEQLLDVIAVLEDEPRPAAFLRWLDKRLHELAAYGLHRLAAEAHASGYVDVEGEPVKVPEVFSIREAARLLERDPAITIGQARLFEYLSAIGWIERAAGVWVPRAHVRTSGLLTTQHVAERHSSHDEPYPQLILTVAGVLELHRRLGGISDLNLTPHPTLNLDEE